MKFKETKLSGVYIIELETNIDSRGSFGRLYCQKEFENFGIDFIPLQNSLSTNDKIGTIRGLHFQKNPFAEAKLVTCLKGKVFEVIVDLREGSETLGEVFTLELFGNKAIYIPKGFAHGFQTLEDDSILLYQISEFYMPDYSSGLRYNDPYFKIDWPIKENFIISDKDNNLPYFETWKNF